MALEALVAPVSLAQLAGQLHAELIDEQQAPTTNSSRHGAVAPVLASFAVDQDTLFSEEHFRQRQRFALRFSVPRAWLLLVLDGLVAFDRDGRDQSRLLNADENCLCLTAASHQEFTVLRAPAVLLRIGFPLRQRWSPGECSMRAKLPLLVPMTRLVIQAQSTGASVDTFARLAAALQGYCQTELASLGVQPVDEQLADSLRRLLIWLSDHLDQPLEVADLAHAACLSPRRLQELCREQFGCRPMELLRRQRLDAMYAQLISPAHAAESLTQLMSRWQLPDSSATRQAFLERYGHPPKKLRKLMESRQGAPWQDLHA